jgi:hypothetical protein
MAILEVLAHHNLSGDEIECCVGIMHSDEDAADLHFDERVDWRIAEDGRPGSGESAEYYVCDVTDAQATVFNELQRLAWQSLMAAMNDGHHMPNERHKEMADAIARETGEEFDLDSLVNGNIYDLRNDFLALPFDECKAKYEEHFGPDEDDA